MQRLSKSEAYVLNALLTAGANAARLNRELIGKRNRRRLGIRLIRAGRYRCRYNCGCQKPGHRDKGSASIREGYSGMMNRISKMAYSIDEFCDALGLSRSTVKRLISAEKVRSVKIGRRVLIPASEIGVVLNDVVLEK